MVRPPIRVGIIGAGFGERVLVKAFRRAGADVAARATRNWRSVVNDPSLDAVAIAVPPVHQPSIALAALRSGKAVFAEKPLAVSLSAARAMTRASQKAKRVTAVDFELSEIPEWIQAESILRQKKLGRIRHVTLVWHVETYANRSRLQTWKNRSKDGGGVLFSFASHSFHYLERFCGPIRALSARLLQAQDLPGPQDTLLVFTAECQSGAAVSASVCSHAYLGSGHRLEFYGEKGTLILENPTDDYGKGFSLRMGLRPNPELKTISISRKSSASEDGRIAPVARLASRFLKACRTKKRMLPGFAEGLRVQELLEACLRSNRLGRKVRLS